MRYPLTNNTIDTIMLEIKIEKENELLKEESLKLKKELFLLKIGSINDRFKEYKI